jgi:hypothetical protein
VQPGNSPNVSEKRVASIFGTDEKTQAGNRHEAGSACWMLHAGFLLGLLFDPEYENCMFLRNKDFHQTAWRYIPGDNYFMSYRVASWHETNEGLASALIQDSIKTWRSCVFPLQIPEV